MNERFRVGAMLVADETGQEPAFAVVGTAKMQRFWRCSRRPQSPLTALPATFARHVAAVFCRRCLPPSRRALKRAAGLRPFAGWHEPGKGKRGAWLRRRRRASLWSTTLLFSLTGWVAAKPR